MPPVCVDDILSLIGNTPLVRIRKLHAGDAHATVWGKCEMLNPGGSVKDRIALAMIEAAEARGQIRPGESVLVEPTSGNTGIGLALVAAVKGYRLILTMPESMSLERRNLLKAYGAEIVLTPEVEWMEGAVARARELCQRPGHVMLHQFENPANPEMHRRTTALELMAQLGDRRVDGFVAAVGTGGTLTGVGEVLRARWPDVVIVAVEPDRSAVLSGDAPGPHKIQGIGAGFVPPVLNTSVFDRVARIRDDEAFRMKQRLAREEGLLVGISAGAAMVAALELAAELGPGKDVVTILCDTGERYFSLDEQFAAAAGA
ncbi:cysteine synthase A [Nannocystis sp. ILAH1]|uniref:cysteine synthase A n=1 Tax=unclassified Nannocystis TaxID=2627009 RepID=UPI00226EF987|nr:MULTISPECIES: cysteine synthase A [unclassified Nannocystis]MCY0993220.1 cysteine synthase A [Nannocystis sp. ILAH1]MCY1063347.1 cysteine synthase A [Nannocystis sp. RBIL2]